MKKIILATILYTGLLIAQVFFASLIAPFNTVNIISIALLSLFFTRDFEKTFLSALALGFLNDYISHAPFVGVGSAGYASALFVIIMLRTTIITNENHISFFFLSIIFNAVYYGIEIVRSFRFSISIFQEALFAVIMNALLAFAVYSIIRFFERQMRRRFM